MGQKSGGCFALGDILARSERRGEKSGVSLFGRLAETPIMVDYLKETWNVLANQLVIVAMNDRDWWDITNNKKEYFDFLVRKNPRVRREALDALKPEPKRPDILTHDGPRKVRGAQLPGGRFEWYEIKPDSPTGFIAWEEKKPGLYKFFKTLPYKPGEAYPSDPSGEKEVPLSMNRAFVYLGNIAKRRGGLQRLRVYMKIRRPEKGLLVYKVCIEIEDERRQEAMAKALAKWIYAAYVVCHFPGKFKEIAAELGDYSFEGDKIPRIRCKFDVLDDLKPQLKSIEEMLYMRGIALPGDRFMLCCDEAYYWELLASRPQGIAYAWQKGLAQAKLWVNYAAGSTVWARIQPWVARAEDVGIQLREKFPYHVQFADAVIEFARNHPAQAILIVSLPLMITAGVAIVFEAGLLAGSIVAEGVVAEAPAVPGLGRVALAEAEATEALGPEVARGAGAVPNLTRAQLAQRIAGGLGSPANDVKAIEGVLSGPALPEGLKEVAGLAAAAVFLLGVQTKTAFAQPAPPKSDGPPPAQLSPNAQVVAQAASKLMLVRPLATGPRNTLRPPTIGEPINLYNYAPVEKQPFTITPLDRLEVRYLGSVEIS
jgi:hypothetical protein